MKAYAPSTVGGVRVGAAAGTVLLAASLAACGASTAPSGAHAAAAGDGTPARISVSGAYIPLPASPDVAVAYFDVTNSGGTPDQLTSVTSPSIQSTALNDSTATSMDSVAAMTVPAHGTTLLARGGKHVMLMGLKPALKVGQRIELNLTFARSGTITVPATIEPLTYQPPTQPPTQSPK